MQFLSVHKADNTRVLCDILTPLHTKTADSPENLCRFHVSYLNSAFLFYFILLLYLIKKNSPAEEHNRFSTLVQSAIVSKHKVTVERKKHLTKGGRAAICLSEVTEKSDQQTQRN